MILTGKNKRTFLKWLKIRVNSKLHEIYKIEFWFNLQDESFKITLIIEWFDSVGIYIIISPSDNPKNWFYTILGEDILSPFYQMYQSLDDFENRQEALTEAIKKANEIYNEKFAQ